MNVLHVNNIDSLNHIPQLIELHFNILKYRLFAGSLTLCRNGLGLRMMPLPLTAVG